jgi:predicted DNA-binding protein YlxM (UPF0122 family)
MFEKNLGIAFLLDFYGEVLDAHTGNILRQYYDEDLSLAEIAESENISRQGVRHIIKKGEEQLSFLEERLGLAEHFMTVRKISDSLLEIADKIAKSGVADAEDIFEKLRQYSGEILNK